jgi:hypothetical protein
MYKPDTSRNAVDENVMTCAVNGVSGRKITVR